MVKSRLQLSISIAQSCRSRGKYLKFIGQEAVIVILTMERKEIENTLKMQSN